MESAASAARDTRAVGLPHGDERGVHGTHGFAAEAVLARAPTKTFGIQGGMNAAAIGAIEMMARPSRWFVEAKQRAAVERQRDAAQAKAPRAIDAQSITLAHESIPDGWLNALRLFPQGLCMTSP